MRILFLNAIGALGGSERSLLDIFAALRLLEPSWELYLIVGDEGPLVEESRRLGVRAELMPLPEEFLALGETSHPGKTFAALFKLQRLGIAGIQALQWANQLRARIDQSRPDVIHSNGVKTHLLTRMIGTIKAPIVWHMRDFIADRPMIRRAMSWASRAAALAVANSEATAIDARKALGRTTVVTVLNGIDTEHFSPGASSIDLDKLSGLPPAPAGTVRVGLLASYARWKGQDIFLEAAAKICRDKSGPVNVRFYVIGGSIHRTQSAQFSLEELRTLAKNLGIAAHVGFIPFQNHPLDVYRALDIVVHASTKPEPFGRTIAEAMSCGRAVVVAESGGAVELFTSGHDALGIAPSDPAIMAAAISRLTNDAQLRQQLGVNARRTACEKFSRERLGLQMRDVFKSLMRA